LPALSHHTTRSGVGDALELDVELASDVGVKVSPLRRTQENGGAPVREFTGNRTFVIRLRVNDDGDMQFAISGGMLEIRFGADESPLALREVRVAEPDVAEFASWPSSERSG
jgi:hypothetical protein